MEESFSKGKRTAEIAPSNQEGRSRFKNNKHATILKNDVPLNHLGVFRRFGRATILQAMVES